MSANFTKKKKKKKSYAVNTEKGLPEYVFHKTYGRNIVLSVTSVTLKKVSAP